MERLANHQTGSEIDPVSLLALVRLKTFIFSHSVHKF